MRLVSSAVVAAEYLSGPVLPVTKQFLGFLPERRHIVLVQCLDNIFHGVLLVYQVSAYVLEAVELGVVFCHHVAAHVDDHVHQSCLL